MKAYQLKLTVKNSKPPIWRRCIVPAGLTFFQLSIILDKVMGWGSSHFPEFEFFHLQLRLREKEDDSLYIHNFLDSSETYINEYMEQEKWFTYTCGFGDGWQHRVAIERVIEDYPLNYPAVIKYKGSCPMEGSGAYQMDDVNEELKENFGLTASKTAKNNKADLILQMAAIKQKRIRERILILESMLLKFDEGVCAYLAAYHEIDADASLDEKERCANLAKGMLVPATMRKVLILLRDEENDAFQKAMGYGLGYLPQGNEALLFRKMNAAGYIGICSDGRIDVPSDVALAYQKINTEKFNSVRRRVSWLKACLDVASCLYGVVPVDIMVQVFRQNPDIYTDRTLLIKDFSQIRDKQRGFVLEDDLFVDEDLLKISGNDKALMRLQEDSEYYIPTADEIVDFDRNGFFYEDRNMQRLLRFMMEKMGADEKAAKECAREMYSAGSRGCRIQDFFCILEDNDIFLESESDVDKLIHLLSNVMKNTRMLMKRGFKPNEFFQAGPNNIIRFPKQI